MPETKIFRLQQEILIVNGKTISVEGGCIINTYDLTEKEFKDTAKFISDTIDKHIENIDNNKYGFLKEIK